MAIVRPWLRYGLWTGIALVAANVLLRIYIWFRPTATPPLVAPLLMGRIRRRYRQPEQTLAPLCLHDGQLVLEIGAGTGLFTFAAAQQIAPHGTLVSLELQRAMLRTLVRRMGQRRPDNLVLLRADALALPLCDAACDAVLLIAVLPMVADKRQALREVWRVLCPGGLLLVSEELLAPEYVPAFVTRRWGRQAGLTPVQTCPGFWCYSVVFRKGTC